MVDAVLYGRKNGWYLLMGYVVMPDHLHIALSPQKRKVPEIMRGLKGYSSRAINKLMGKQGNLWQQGYRDYVLDKKHAIYQKLKYIEENPVRAGLVINSTEYQFSSVGIHEQLDLEYIS